METLGLYISVPFCRAKCSYCNFASGVFGPARMQGYVDRLCDEIRTAPSSPGVRNSLLPRTVDTIYFGGGTPSLLSPEHFHQIFSALREVFTIAPQTEFTMECAPGQLGQPTLDALLTHGLNRVSLGIQSFVDRESQSVGRLHTRESCLAEITRLRSQGIIEINVDLIAGLPHQTQESWQQSLDQAIATESPHVSVYMLEVDEDSRLGRELIAGGVRYHAHHVPDDALVTDLYTTACEQLSVANIPQYEISNFARPGHASRHNLKYWKRQPYLGLGLDAHSMLPTATGAVRFSNTDNLDHYINQTSTGEFTAVTHNEAFEESLFLGLRLNSGLSLQSLRETYGTARTSALEPTLKTLCENNLLTKTDSYIRLTQRGRLLSNEVFSELLNSDAYITA